MPAPDWRPSCGLEAARRRAAMLAAVRRFFAERGVLEVDTPLLSAATVSDPHIESLCVVSGGGRQRYLQTSPEYFMKRLLCAGWPDIYQVCKAFRDGEAGRRHRLEFTLIEWYRLGFDLPAIMRETAALIESLLAARVRRDAEYLEYAEAFRRHAGVEAAAADVDELAAAAGADGRMRAALGADRDAWLDLLVTGRVAPGFPRDRLTVLYHYPASQSALARLCPADPAVADRFEVFLGELELANGFVELRDPAEQRRRFEHNLARRRERGQPRHPLDERFIAALEAGLPECAGVAVGFDRLLMLDRMAEDIAEVWTFSEEADER